MPTELLYVCFIPIFVAEFFQLNTVSSIGKHGWFLTNPCAYSYWGCDDETLNAGTCLALGGRTASHAGLTRRWAAGPANYVYQLQAPGPQELGS